MPQTQLNEKIEEALRQIHLVDRSEEKRILRELVEGVLKEVIPPYMSYTEAMVSKRRFDQHTGHSAAVNEMKEKARSLGLNIT